MGSDATAEIQHLSAHGHALQPQGVGDVVRTAQVPGGQLEQVARPHRVFVETGRVLRPEGTGVEIRQIIGAAGQPLLHLLKGKLQITAEVLFHRKTVLQERLHIHAAAVTELGHGGEPMGCNSLSARRPAALDGPFGFVVIDKPAGLTSHSCVSRLRRCYGLRRVGHGGTLDPAVTGVLPIALGPATRLLPYLPGEKTYRGVIQLGRTTSTDDLEGELLTQQPWPSLDVAELETALAGFRGSILQRPPQVSAVHVDGERAHARARRGEVMDLPPRPVTLHRLDLLRWDADNGQLHLEVHCSSGTYIRSLARDLGQALGCGGCLASLRRTQALGFHDHQASPLPDADRDDPPPEPLSPLLALGHLPHHQLSPSEQIDWRCGRRLELATGPGEAVVVCNPDGSMAGIGLREAPNLLRPKVVFDAAG